LLEHQVSNRRKPLTNSENKTIKTITGDGKTFPNDVGIADMVRPTVSVLPAVVAGIAMLTICVVFSHAPARGQGTAHAPVLSREATGAEIPLQTEPLDKARPAVGSLAKAGPKEHPLMPALHWAEQGLPTIQNLADYSAVLVKREQVHGQLGEYEYLFLKIRHKPFSVYAKFLAPASVCGQEVLYVKGQNNGNMWAHKPHLPGNFSIQPDSLVAMRGRRYPLTEIGMVNLVCRLVEVAQKDIQYGECDVKFLKGAKVNGRLCTVIQVVHPHRRREFCFHLARVFVDDELNMPTRYESYDWPQEAGEQPELIEEYTYLDLKLNNGFTDNDFSLRNSSYRFQ
jgi:hypothetical protein